MLKGELPIRIRDQLKAYLEANHRDAESLLAAYQATHDRALLDEAVAKHPNDPRVAYAAWFHSPAIGEPGALEAHRQALDLFKRAAPDNALANYLSAANAFPRVHPAFGCCGIQDICHVPPGSCGLTEDMPSQVWSSP